LKKLGLICLLFSIFACAQETKIYELKEDSTPYIPKEVDHFE